MPPVDAEYAESILDKMRVMLKKRGADGLIGLGRNFRICDSDGSGKLNVSELAKCFTLCKLNLKPAEVETLFDYFDADDEGTVSFEEFIRAVRGKMSEPRKKLVIKCFNALDAAGDGSGFLTIEDIRPAFNAADHPDVKEEKKTEEQVLQDFLNAFEGEKGNRDGTVTVDEWINYYESISSSIDEDDYFGTMLANTWCALKAVGPNGEEVNAITYVSEGDMDVLEKVRVAAGTTPQQHTDNQHLTHPSLLSLCTDPDEECVSEGVWRQRGEGAQECVQAVRYGRVR